MPVRPFGRDRLEAKWNFWKWTVGSAQLSIWAVLCVEGSSVTVLVTVGTDWAEERYGTA